MSILLKKPFLDRVSITLQIPAVVSALIIVCSFFIIGLIEIRLTDRLKNRIVERNSGLARSVAEQLNHEATDLYEKIKTVAEIDRFFRNTENRHQEQTAWLSKLKIGSPQFAWIAIVNTNGIVEAATDGILEGKNVSDRYWFKSAIQAPVFGDTQEAVPLESILTDSSGRNVHFTKMATPILDASGQVSGIVVAYLYPSWVSNVQTKIFTPDRAFSGTNLYIVDAKGRIIFSDLNEVNLNNLASFKKAFSNNFGAETEFFNGIEALVGFAPTSPLSSSNPDWIVLAITPTNVAYAIIDETQIGLALFGLIAGAGGAIFSYIITRRLTKPLACLAEDAERSGNTLDTVFLSRSGGSREVVRLSQALRALIRRIGTYEQSLASVSAEASALAEDNSSLREQAMTDPMTGLLNRRGFFESVDSLLTATAKPADDISVLVLDIDRFKAINDAHGHTVGDTVIKGVALLCRQQGRDSDLVARFGGEEFVVLLPGCPGPAAVARADRLRRLIAETPISTKAGPVSVTVSIGIALQTGVEGAITKVIDRADQALYHAKRNGRNRVEARFQMAAE